MYLETTICLMLGRRLMKPDFLRTIIAEQKKTEAPAKPGGAIGVWLGYSTRFRVIITILRNSVYRSPVAGC